MAVMCAVAFMLVFVDCLDEFLKFQNRAVPIRVT